MKRLIIRISERGMAFATDHYDTGTSVEYEPYSTRSGISAAANLREALKTSKLLSRTYDRTEVLLDTPMLLVPLDEFQDDEAATLYRHTFLGFEQHHIDHVIIAELYSVAVFAVNKDLLTVVGDHFAQHRFMPVSLPVWRHLRIRANNGQRKKLFAYFHDAQVELFSCWQNRIRFYNTFPATQEHDALYYLLYVWRQTGLNTEMDEMHIVGDIPHQDWLTERLRQFLRNVSIINPSDDLMNAPATQTPGMPYDLMTLLSTNSHD